MTSSTLPIPMTTGVPGPAQASSLDAAETRDDGACDVCPHPFAGHDAIGARYCSATVAGAFTRGCVCRS